MAEEDSDDEDKKESKTQCCSSKLNDSGGNLSLPLSRNKFTLSTKSTIIARLFQYNMNVSKSSVQEDLYFADKKATKSKDRKKSEKDLREGV